MKTLDEVINERIKQMTTKIDISSLDDATKNKIEQLMERCKELSKGVEITINMPITLKCSWTEGESCDVHNWGNYPKYEVDWDLINKHEKELEQKVNAEIKEILDFSNSVADRLGVDRDEFFFQYFA